MVRRAEGACAHQPAARKQPGHRMYFGGLQRLFKRKGRQNARQALCQHAFARAGRADKQGVVPARGGHLQRAPRLRLAAHIGKIQKTVCRLRRIRRMRLWQNGRLARKVAHHVARGVHRVNAKALCCGCLGSVFRRHKQLAQAGLPRGQRHGQNPGHAAHGAVQRKLAQKCRVGRRHGRLAARAQKGQKNGQVIHRARLAHMGGRKVHRHAACRVGKAQVLQRAAHPVCRFLYGAVRQAHNGKLRQAAAHVRLHAHGKARHTLHAQAVYSGKHRYASSL